MKEISKNWFFKYKLYHIPFWFVYDLLWWTISVGGISNLINSLSQKGYFFTFLIYYFVRIISVCFNLYYLIPNLLYKDKKLLYFLAVILLTVITAFIIAIGYKIGFYGANSIYSKFKQDNIEALFKLFASNTLPYTTTNMTLAMSIHIAKNWLVSEKKQHILAQEKVETELKYLKSQINPHFLFNTINSIFVLIHKNQDLASETLATFSEMLRYQLYECNDAEIDLSKEIDFLENFVELEKLRLENTNIHFEVQNLAVAGQKIAPFILIPFIENAFKHVSKGNNQDHWIRIDLKIDTTQLVLEIENSVGMEHGFLEKNTQQKGIGLVNVQRRLDLLYPNRHQLVIETKNNSHKIKLVLELKQL